jgi:hypothetical protein
MAFDLNRLVQRLDDLAIHSAAFLKVDIEGAEIAARSAGTDTIRRFRPRLARRYTEGIDETVMFFLPTDGPR